MTTLDTRDPVAVAVVAAIHAGDARHATELCHRVTRDRADLPHHRALS